MARLLAALALLAASCASSAGPSPVGRWIVDDGVCAFLLGVYDDGTYRFGRMCYLDGGGVGAELEDGEYTHTDTSVTFYPDRVTCPRGQVPWTVGYRLDGDGMQIETRLAVVFYTAAPESDGSASGAALLGCWEGTTFTREGWAAP